MTATSRQAARDAEARRTALTRFDRPLVIEAGAGTGKTTLLVGRILSWCLADGWKAARSELENGHGRPAEAGEPDDDRIAGQVLDGVVAITFTEAASAEMATQLARGLAAFTRGEEERIPGLGTLPLPSAVALEVRRRRARALIGALDRLTVQTIHAWCRSLLADYPLQAGLAPDLTVDAEGRRIEEVVRRVVEERTRDAYASSAAHPLSRLAARGIGPGRVAEALETLITKGLPAAALERDPLTAEPATRLRLARRLDAFRDAAGDDLAGVKRGKLAPQIDRAVDASRTAVEAISGNGVGSLADLLCQLAEIWPPNCLKHLAGWSRHRFSDAEAEALGARAPALAEAAGVLGRLLAHLLRLDPSLLALAREALAPLLHEAERELRARGLVTFHALLVEAERLLRTDAEVLTRERQRRRQLLVDEFQDTDRLQCSLVQMLALGEPSEQGPVLFVVGDPKQSIYGWRDADLEAYDELVEAVRRAEGEVLPLVVNFRSVPAVLEEVSRVVAPVMRPQVGLQPAFEPLVASATLAGEPGFADGRWAPVEHWVSWLAPADDRPKSGPATLAGDAASLEARAVAADIRALHDERGVEWSEVGILMRTTSSLSTFLEALRDADVPFVVSRDRDYYRRREVIEAAALVRTVVDPLDHLALLTFLRSSAVGVPDAALIPLWGRQLPRLLTELKGPDPAAAAHLREVIAAAAEATPGDLPGVEAVAGWPASLSAAVDTLGRLRRAFARDPADRFLEQLRLGTAFEITESARYPQHYRRANLERFFRRLEESLEERAGDAPALLRALRRAVAEAEEAEEAAPLEATENVVRVMTVHGAKGLQFDHVYLVQLHSKGRGGNRPQVDVEERGRSADGPEYVLFGAPTLEFDRVEERRRRVAAAERVRILYVAMTRAAKRLVMAGCWPQTPTEAPPPEAAASHLDLVLGREGLPDSLERLLDDCRDQGTTWRDAGAARWRFPDLAPPRRPASRSGTATFDLAIGDAEAAVERLAGRRRAARARMGAAFQGAASAESRARLERLLDDRESSAPAGARDVALAVGDAVHRLLETWDLEAPRERESERQRELLMIRLAALLPPDLVAAGRQRAERLLDRIERGSLLSRLLELGTYVVARELPVVLPAAGDDGPVGFISGVVDLVYRDPRTGEPVIVDYKTDELEGAGSIDDRAAAYEPQERLYARALQEALDLPDPPASELWFLWPDRVWKNARRQ